MPKLNSDDTIAAISTPLGEGGISVVRLSGKRAMAIAERVLVTGNGGRLREAASHTARYGQIVDESGKVLDEVVVTIFREPRSYTREEMVEISAHGGLLVARKILELLLRRGARLAEPGEFTKRAFLNGRIDLTQAEAVLDLIRAKSDRSLEAALRQLRGGLSREIHEIKEKLVRLAAHMEAYVDFPEEDIEVFSNQEFLRNVNEIIDRVAKLIKSYDQGAILREGILAVIVGRPNVGKSSLLNALLDRDRALVSESPGTTRDVLEEMVHMDGLLVRLADTAGIHPEPDLVEKMGIEKARELMKQANLFLMVLDGSEPVTEVDEQIYEEIRSQNHLLVVNKADLPLRLGLGPLKSRWGEENLYLVSSKNHQGLEELQKGILSLVGERKIDCEGSLISRLRHQQALGEALRSLERAKKALLERLSLEFIAFDLRQALASVGEIVGEVYTADILDKIFSEFCIGK
jgi:tRNA modification GTPase